MTIDDMMKKTEIKKILVVDDTEANILAAKEFFSKLESSGIRAEYATNANDAKEMIKKAYSEKNNYGLIISDLTMEQPESGLEVIREGFKHFTYGFIVTGCDYGHHGSKTTILPVYKSISGKKDKPEVWESAFNMMMIHLTEGYGSAALAAIKRAGRCFSQPSDGIADTAMNVFRD